MRHRSYPSFQTAYHQVPSPDVIESLNKLLKRIVSATASLPGLQGAVKHPVGTQVLRTQRHTEAHTCGPEAPNVLESACFGRCVE
jgi:hypothetical protein